MVERDGIPALKSGRATIERALALDAPVWVLRVLLVVIADTALWSRFEAPVTHRRVIELTSMPQRQVSRAFAWLTENEVLGYQPGYSLPNGPRSSSIVTLTMDRSDPRSDRPTVSGGADHRPQRVATMDRVSPPNGDPSRISRTGGAVRSGPPPVRSSCGACGGSGWTEDDKGDALPCNACRIRRAS